MPAVDALTSRKTALSALCVIIACLCVTTLAGCKKDQEQTETGGVKSSPVSVIEGAVIEDMAETTPPETLPPLPSPDMKGLRVEVAPSQNAPAATPASLPEMVPVPSMEMSVRLSPRMQITPGWSQQFAALLPPIMDCLMKVDGGVAYVTHVAAHDGGDKKALRIDISGLDEGRFKCRIAENVAPSVTQIDDADQMTSILFFPRRAGAPVLGRPECFETEPVVARPNGLIGWLAFPLDDSLNDCTAAGPD